MNVWCHLPTIINRRNALRIAGLLSLCVALTTTLLLGSISNAAAGVNQTLSFQGRLTDASGNVVQDGYYNIQFKIYQNGDGTAAGDTSGSGGTLDWTETYLNNGGNNGVKVTDGFFSVNLGSENPFGTSVDWNNDTLWLSMNVAGDDTSCSTFNGTGCAADGEMLPMKQITSTPYSLNSGELDGKTADNFIQLGQGVQTDASTNTSSIYLNKTGTGNLVQLQSASTDVFTVGNAGDLTLGNNADKTISIATATADTTGNTLTVSAGAGGSGTGAAGGDLDLQGGDAGGTNGDGGNVNIDAGAATGTGNTGTISIGATNAGTVTIGSDVTGATSNVTIGSGSSAAAGTTAIQSKDDTTVTTNGTQEARFSGTSNTLFVGNADTSGQATTANGFTIQGTSSTGSDTQGGSLTVQSGSATSGDANGGNLTLSGGTGSGTGATGLVVINTPTFQTSSEQDFSTDGSISQSSIDGNGAILVKATAASETITMNDPTITTAGRLIYVMATSDSDDFKLSINGGTLLTLHPGTTAPLIWDGSNWSIAGGSSAASLQDTYDTTVQSDGTGNVVLSNGTDNNGLTLSNSATAPVSGSLLNVTDADSNSLFAVNGSNVKIGGGSGTTLLTLDTASSAPTVSDSSLIGSMYYDTTIDALQCYKSTGWGSCDAAPDDFVTLSPTYANAVTHGDGVGTLTTDFCSDSLNINNGTSSQPSVCGTNETHNYYNWTASDPTTAQTKSIYVTYQLPSTFTKFVSSSTSLAARTDSSDASVSYTVYHNSSSGLTACGSAVSVSTGSQTSWQTATAATTADPANCDFAAGDSIVFKIDLTADNDANAYVSNLNFAFQ